MICNTNGGKVYKTDGNGTKFLSDNGEYKKLKTINGTSLLGSGDIAISAAYPVVEHTPLEETVTIAPNTYHVWDDVEVLNISFGEGASGVANEYVFQFFPTYAAFTLTLPSNVEWVNGEAPAIQPNAHTYVVSIVNNLAVWAEF